MSVLRVASCLTVVSSMVLAQPAILEENPVGDVLDEGRKAKIVERFESDLGELGASVHIEKCSFILEVRYNAGRNSSFGAICRVNTAKGRRALLMCDDWMIGRFTLKNRSYEDAFEKTIDDPSQMDPTMYGSFRDYMGKFITGECPPSS